MAALVVGRASGRQHAPHGCFLLSSSHPLISSPAATPLVLTSSSGSTKPYCRSSSALLLAPYDENTSPPCERRIGAADRPATRISGGPTMGGYTARGRQRARRRQTRRGRSARREPSWPARAGSDLLDAAAGTKDERRDGIVVVPVDVDSAPAGMIDHVGQRHHRHARLAAHAQVEALPRDGSGHVRLRPTRKARGAPSAASVRTAVAAPPTARGRAPAARCVPQWRRVRLPASESSGTPSRRGRSCGGAPPTGHRQLRVSSARRREAARAAPSAQLVPRAPPPRARRAAAVRRARRAS